MTTGTNGNGLLPINVAIITSFREIVGDELVGQTIDLRPHFPGPHRRIGNIEDLVQRANADGFGQRFNVVAVLADDWSEALDTLFGTGQYQWPWPVNLQAAQYDAHGNPGERRRLADHTHFISSQPWRSVRGDRIEKAKRKGRYEHALAEVLDRVGADLIVSDSYTSIMGHYHLPYFSGHLLERFGGRAINIHPAVVVKDHPNRLPGLTPTADAIRRFEESGYDRTGVTVHVIDGEIDHGPTIAWDEQTPVLPADLTHTLAYAGEERRGHLLRERNYVWKRELLPRALQQYAADAAIQALMLQGREERQLRLATYSNGEAPLSRYARYALPVTGAVVVQQYGLDRQRSVHDDRMANTPAARGDTLRVSL